MSKWTIYQWGIVIGFIVLCTMKNIFLVPITQVLSVIEQVIPSSLLIIFFTVILVVWGWALIFYCQEKKGKSFLTHKIWAIMPAIVGGIFLLSFIALIICFTMFSLETHWILDSLVVYFLSLFYFLLLSIVLRYGKSTQYHKVIFSAANYAVLVLFAIFYLLPIV